MKNHGQQSLAKKYLKHAEKSEHTMVWYSALARDALKRMETLERSGAGRRPSGRDGVDD